MKELSIRVGCVGQEYWHIRRQTCDCGGRFERTGMVSQKVDVKGISGPWDVMETSCVNCGKQRIFEFDISLFYGPKLTEMRTELLEKYCQGLPLEEALRAVDNATASPMEKTLLYLTRLAETNDTLALDYLSDAIECAKRKISDTRP